MGFSAGQKMSRVLCIIVAYGSDFTLTRVHYPIGNGSVLGCQGGNLARGMALVGEV